MTKSWKLENERISHSENVAKGTTLGLEINVELRLSLTWKMAETRVNKTSYLCLNIVFFSESGCFCKGGSERSHSTLVLLPVLPDAQESERRLPTHGLLPGDLQRTGTRCRYLLYILRYAHV